MTLRRDFLGFTAGAVASRTVLPIAARAEGVAVTAIPPDHPDAELLAACSEFDRLERAYLAVGFDHEHGSPEQAAAEAERERLSDLQEPLVDRICELRAVTMEGLAARARSLALWDAELMKSGPGTTDQRLTAAIVRDLIG